MFADLNRDGSKITLDGDPRDRHRIKTLPGARFGSQTKEWTVPLTWASCKILRNVWGSDLVVGPALESWAWVEFNRRVSPSLEARNGAEDPDEDWPGRSELYPHQRAGVDFLGVARSAVLADEPGAGKTATVIETLERSNIYPTLVVAPKSVLGAWKKEFARWAPLRKVVIASGSAAQRRKALAEEADVYCINYEAVRLHSRVAGYGSIRLKDGEKEEKELNRNWAAVVADEAHRLKDPKSKQTRAVKAVGQTATQRLALTGTPLANHPGDFWSIMNFVSPDEWPSRVKFVDMFCDTTWNAWGGTDITGLKRDMQGVFFSIVDPRFLRRQKAVVLRSLPEKVYLQRYTDLTPKQRKLYKDLKKEMLAELETGDLVVTEHIALLGRLVQSASTMLDVTEGGTVECVEPSNKLDALEEILTDLDDEPAVVFAVSKKLINLAEERLERHGITTTRITGDETSEQRIDAIDDFQKGRVRVILCTVGAGSEGITLTRSRNLIFLQRPWSLVQSVQAEDRVHRPGAEVHENVRIWDIISNGTIDEDVISKLEDKEDRLEELTRDRQALKRILS